VVNDLSYQAIGNAKAAWDAWLAAGCGPWTCGVDCMVGGASYCDPATSKCVSVVY
jgi:hypothetical protein